MVTGAAQGLGAAFARALAGEGMRVLLCDVKEGAAEVARDIGEAALALRMDVSRPDDARSAVATALDAFGALDLLVNNAGVHRETHPTDSITRSIADYEHVVGTNLKGAFLLGRAAIPHLIARGGGEIVNVSTDHVCTCGAPDEEPHDDAPGCPWAGRPPRPTGGGPAMDLYDASKWGLVGLTLAWSRALRPYRVRANALCMGATDTPMLREAAGDAFDAEQAAAWMRPEQIAGLMLDLLREGPEGRTGERIGIAMGHPVRLPPRRAASGARS